MRGENVLKINLEFRKGILFIRLNGILNEQNSYELTKKINYFIKKNGIRFFTFNLEGLEEVNQDTIRMIKENYQQIISIQGKLVLCGVKDKRVSMILHDVEQSKNELGVFQMIQI